MKLIRILIISVAASLGWAASAHANTVQCASKSVDVTSFVTNTSGCEWSTTHYNDPASSPVEVNVDQFFGFSDWKIAQQGINQNASNGTWNVTGYANYANYDWMIVLKDSNAYKLVGYYAPTYFSGTWITPFVADLDGSGVPSRTNHDVSHISYYYRPSSSPPVPEPGTLVLLGTGVAALALRFRRRRA